jgi:carbonic anhydrase
MADFGKLVSGFRIFKATKYAEQKDVIGHLIRQGVKAKTLFITCSDLRIGPDVIFSSNPGDFFVVRNLAALVPTFESDHASGSIAAIEYAVLKLNVENIVVLGHANCDGIKALMAGDKQNDGSENHSSAMLNWLSIAKDAKDAVNTQLANKTDEEKEEACQFESILVSLKHLITYPFINERINDDRLKIYGWHFNINNGTLLAFNPESKYFDPIG